MTRGVPPLALVGAATERPRRRETLRGARPRELRRSVRAREARASGADPPLGVGAEGACEARGGGPVGRWIPLPGSGACVTRRHRMPASLRQSAGGGLDPPLPPSRGTKKNEQGRRLRSRHTIRTGDGDLHYIIICHYITWWHTVSSCIRQYNTMSYL